MFGLYTKFGTDPQKPLKAYKIIPDEISAYRELEFTRISEYIPKWRLEENEAERNPASDRQVLSEPYLAEDADDYSHINITPNFGTNANAFAEQTEKTTDAEALQLTLDETVFDPNHYTETDTNGVLDD